MDRQPPGPIADLANEIDGWLDSAIGIRPLAGTLGFVNKILPANVINDVTGIPKPDKFLDKAADNVEGVVDGVLNSSPINNGGKMPGLPKPSDLLP